MDQVRWVGRKLQPTPFGDVNTGPVTSPKHYQATTPPPCNSTHSYLGEDPAIKTWDERPRQTQGTE